MGCQKIRAGSDFDQLLYAVIRFVHNNVMSIGAYFPVKDELNISSSSSQDSMWEILFCNKQRKIKKKKREIKCSTKFERIIFMMS